MTVRLALFGGTFDPIHNGHLLLAECARERFRLDRVIFLPVFEPPHKHRPVASSKDRLAMVRRAIRGNSAFAVSDWEIRQKRVVYTVETVEHFRGQRPPSAWYFIVGSDSLRDLPQWRESRRLQRLCRVIGLDRFEPFASHEIRDRVRRGLSIRYHVPEAVGRYIQSHRLYRKPE